MLRPGTYSNGAVHQPELPAGDDVQPDRRHADHDVRHGQRRGQQAVQNVDSNDPNVKQSYNAFEFNFNARLPHGARLFGGSATDRTIANTCSARGDAIRTSCSRSAA